MNDKRMEPKHKKVFMVESSCNDYDGSWFVLGIYTKKHDAEKLANSICKKIKALKKKCPPKNSANLKAWDKWYKFTRKYPMVKWLDPIIRELPLNKYIKQNQ